MTVTDWIVPVLSAVLGAVGVVWGAVAQASAQKQVSASEKQTSLILARTPTYEALSNRVMRQGEQISQLQSQVTHLIEESSTDKRWIVEAVVTWGKKATPPEPLPNWIDSETVALLAQPQEGIDG